MSSAVSKFFDGTGDGKVDMDDVAYYLSKVQTWAAYWFAANGAISVGIMGMYVLYSFFDWSHDPVRSFLYLGAAAIQFVLLVVMFVAKKSDAKSWLQDTITIIALFVSILLLLAPVGLKDQSTAAMLMARYTAMNQAAYLALLVVARNIYRAYQDVVKENAALRQQIPQGDNDTGESDQGSADNQGDNAPETVATDPMELREGDIVIAGPKSQRYEIQGDPEEEDGKIKVAAIHVEENRQCTLVFPPGSKATVEVTGGD